MDLTASLLYVGPVNHRNKKGKSIDSVALLSTVLVEPIYLQLTSNTTFFDANIAKSVEFAQGLSPKFQIIHYDGIPLVVQCYDSHEQIVLPSFSGFQTLEIEEYHISSLIRHLGACKTFELFC